MNFNLFDQFTVPTLLSYSILPLTILIPTLFFPAPKQEWIINRLTSVLSLVFKTFTKQILTLISTQGYKWFLPLIFTGIILITVNLIGLLPYTFTPTTQLSLNLALALPLWIITILVGFRHQFSKTLGHTLPEGTPTLLIPIIIVIDTISLIIRPIALGVRLTANLTAGHLLMKLISLTVLSASSTMPSLSFLLSITLIVFIILEIAVAIIQAYVFVILLSLYLQENT